MKHIYNPSSAAITLQSATKALGTALSGKIFTLLFLSFFLLVSGESWGANFTSRVSGEWNSVTTWNMDGRAATRLPNANDNVNIGAHDITVTANASCSQLNLGTGNGNPNTYTFTINNNIKLTASRLNLTTGAERTRVLNINGELEVLGDLSLAPNGGKIDKAVLNGNTGTIRIGGTFSNAGTFNKGTGTVEYTGNGTSGANQAIANVDYHHLILTGSRQKSVSADLNISGNFTVNSTLNAGNFSHTVSGNLINTGTINASTSIIKIGGAFTNTGTFNKGTSTVEYNGAAQTIANVGYHNLTLAGSNTKTPSAALNVSGNFTVNSGTTFNAGDYTHTVSGNFVNAGRFNSGDGTVLMNGAAAQAISFTGQGNFNNLTMSGAGTKTASSNLPVSGDFTINSNSAFNAASYTHTVSGNLTNSGNLNPGTSTFELNGVNIFPLTAQHTITFNGTGSFNNLILSGGGLKTANNALRILGNFTVNGAWLNLHYFNAGGHTHTVSGNFYNAGNFLSGSGTIELNGNANQTIYFAGAGDLNNLTISGTGIKTATSNLPIGGNLTVNSGTFNAGSFTHTVSGNVSNAGTIDGSTSTIRTGGNFSSTGTLTPGTSTVELNASANRTVSFTGQGSFNNLIVAGSGIKTADSNLPISGNLTVNSGSTFNAGSNRTHTISGNVANAGTFTASTNTIRTGGNFTNTGAFNAGASTIELNGVDKSISSTNALVFNNLTLSNGAKSLLSNVTVNSTIALNAAILSTGDNKVVLGNTASILGESADQNIMGTVEATRAVTTSATQAFGGIGFSIINSNADFGQVTVSRTTGTSHLERNEQSANRQYIVSSTAGSGVIGTNLAFSFAEYDLNAPKEDTYDLYKFTQDNIMRLATSVPYSSIPIITTSDIAGMYTLYSSSIIPLPVELTSFNARRHTKGVMLTWETASELDNKGFEVQVSTNARDFKAIDFVESKVGTTSLKQNYSFLDTKAVSGTRYYRLKQIDFDGTSSFSAIKAVALDGYSANVSAYPNPFDDVVVVTLNGSEARTVQVVLLDAMGKVLQQRTEETAGNSISVDMTGVKTKGMYILHVLDNDTKHTFKLMKR
ncbi:T9SS type A sorting domain-containing protein [uncultured Pontibacter sp.]|uniref:T9SS type A sorting domain-containing protein n=1 Tax=uncultured Pontibacter sp. TaxID=453356 RepID=UPI00262208F2|nr:T9SS type A sorting domain-containing protein [uncultured Pontibacter sp.]